MSSVVFVDADVLYSATLRGWIINFATGGDSGETGGFELALTEGVIAEAVARWHDNHPRARGAVITRMAEVLREVSTMVRDFDAEIDFPGSDDGDIHVHAAAVASGAGYLVTRDTGFLDLADEVKDTLPYEIYDPDEFLVLVSKQSARRLREVTRSTMRHYSTRDRENPQMVPRLVAAGAPQFAEIIDRELAALAGARRYAPQRAGVR